MSLPFITDGFSKIRHTKIIFYLSHLTPPILRFGSRKASAAAHRQTNFFASPQLK